MGRGSLGLLTNKDSRSGPACHLGLQLSLEGGPRVLGEMQKENRVPQKWKYF